MKTINVQFKDIPVLLVVYQSPSEISDDYYIKEIFGENYTFKDIVDTLNKYPASSPLNIGVFTYIKDTDDNGDYMDFDYIVEMFETKDMIWDYAEADYLEEDMGFVFEYNNKLYVYSERID